MIHDAKGRLLYRKIGFEGGLKAETNPKKTEMITCVSGTFVEVGETEGAEGETPAVKHPDQFAKMRKLKKATHGKP